MYALGALLLTAAVALTTFTLVRARLLTEAQDAAREQVFRNAVDLRRRLQSIPDPSNDPFLLTGGETELGELALPETTTTTEEEPPETSRPADFQSALDSFGIPPATSATTVPAEAAGPNPADQIIPPTDPILSVLRLLVYTERVDSLLVLDGEDRSLSGLTEANLPGGLRFLVEQGEVAEQRYSLDGRTLLAVGVPLADIENAQYYEVTSLDNVESTLGLLQVILGGTALAASVAGATLGWYSTRRALQPLVDVSSAAESIADGQFDIRLDDDADPDLEALTSSFNGMVDALQRRIERDGRFASDVSHELRSPLQTLAASVAVLEARRDDLPEPAQRAIDLLGEEVHRFGQLVGDLLEISRMDVGAVEADLGPVFLVEFLRFVLVRSRNSDVPINVPATDTHLVVEVDKRRLGQVLTNLLDNATKYAGGATEVGFERHDDQVMIYVEDRGPGVDATDRNRVFDRFTRAGTTAGRRERATGVGLGLSLVAEHVRLHGGEVAVIDRVDGESGARFVITLPVGVQYEHDEELAT